MAEPFAAVAVGAKTLGGLNAVLLLSGLFGGVVSLSYLKPLTRWQAAMAVLSGALLANYLTPMALWYAKIPHEFQLGTGFLIGLTGMHIVPMLLGVAKRIGERGG